LDTRLQRYCTEVFCKNISSAEQFITQIASQFYNGLLDKVKEEGNSNSFWKRFHILTNNIFYQKTFTDLQDKSKKLGLTTAYDSERQLNLPLSADYHGITDFFKTCQRIEQTIITLFLYNASRPHSKQLSIEEHYKSFVKDSFITASWSKLLPGWGLIAVATSFYRGGLWTALLGRWYALEQARENLSPNEVTALATIEWLFGQLTEADLIRAIEANSFYIEYFLEAVRKNQTQIISFITEKVISKLSYDVDAPAVILSHPALVEKGRLSDEGLIQLIKKLSFKEKFTEVLAKNSALITRLQNGELLVKLVTTTGFTVPILCQPAFLESNCLSDNQFMAISEHLFKTQFAELLNQTAFLQRLNSKILYSLICNDSEFEHELLKNETAINKFEAQEIVTLISETYEKRSIRLLQYQLITKKLSGDDLVQIVFRADSFSDESIAKAIAQTEELASKLNNNQVTQIALKNDNLAKTLFQEERMISILQYPNVLQIAERFPRSSIQRYFDHARETSRLRWLEAGHPAEEWLAFPQHLDPESLQYILADVQLLANLARDEGVLKEILNRFPSFLDLFNNALIKSLSWLNNKAFAEVISSFQDFLIKHLTAEGLIKLAAANPELIKTILVNPQLLIKLTDEQLLRVIQQIPTPELLIEILSQEGIIKKISAFSLWASLIKITKPYDFVSALINSPSALACIADSLMQDPNLLLTNADLTLAIISSYPEEVTSILNIDSNRHLGEAVVVGTDIEISLTDIEISLNELLALRKSYQPSSQKTFLEFIQESLQKNSEENGEEQREKESEETAENNTPNENFYEETHPLITSQQTDPIKVSVENTPAFLVARPITTGKILALVFLALISMVLLATGIGAIAGSPLFVVAVSSLLAWLASMVQTTLVVLAMGITLTAVTTVLAGFTFKDKIRQAWSHGLSWLGIKSPQEVSKSPLPNPSGARAQQQPTSPLNVQVRPTIQFPNKRKGCCSFSFWSPPPVQSIFPGATHPTLANTTSKLSC
jgi:hypothetical protein